MVFVCGVLRNGILYVIDDRYYSTSIGAKKRCTQLNEERSNGDWIVLYQDNWKVFE